MEKAQKVLKFQNLNRVGTLPRAPISASLSAFERDL